MSEIDWQQWVDLTTTNAENDDPPRNGEFMWGTKVGIFRLCEAVQLVIEKWAPGSRRQMSATITLDSAPHFLDLTSIRALYDRSDFPGSV